MVRFLKLSAGKAATWLACFTARWCGRAGRRWTPLTASHASAACPTTWRMRFCMQCARDPASSASGTISLAGAVTAGHSLPERKAGEGATACLTLRCARGCILHPCDALLGQRVDRSSDQLRSSKHHALVLLARAQGQPPASRGQMATAWRTAVPCKANG